MTSSDGKMLLRRISALARVLFIFPLICGHLLTQLAIITIITYYVSHIGEAKDCLLGLKRVLGAHTGENMAQSITFTIEDYKLQDRIGKKLSLKKQNILTIY